MKRKHRTIEPFLTENIQSFSTGKHVEKELKKQFVILENEALLKSELKKFWTEYFDGKKSWER